MERNFERISDGLKMPRESRERIRSRLASCVNGSEEIPVKKLKIKKRVPIIAVAVVAVIGLTLTTAAALGHVFRNDIIVSSKDDIPMPGAESDDLPASGYAVIAPGGLAPIPLETMEEDSRAKSEDWDKGERINGGVVSEYFKWDSATVLTDSPALRSRLVTRSDGAEKLEYTAHDPASLLDTLTGRVAFDLTWLGENYDYSPDADLSFVVTDPEGNYVSECLDALYVKKDRSGYVDLTVYHTAQADYFDQTYVIDGSFEASYYYTTDSGYEFLINADSGNVWAECRTTHATVSLRGAYLTTGEMEDILDNLALAVNE